MILWFVRNETSMEGGWLFLPQLYRNYAPWSHFEGVRKHWFGYKWTEKEKQGLHGQTKYLWGFRILGWSFAWEPEWQQ